MIITAGPIAYNGVTANPGLTAPAGGGGATGYQMAQLDISQIEEDEYVEQRPLQDGANSGDAYLGKRVLTIEAVVFGSSAGDFADKVEQWMAAFSAPITQMADTYDKTYETRVTSHGFLPLTCYLPTADIATYPLSAFPNGIPIQFFARPMAPPRMTEQQDAQGGRPKLGTSVKTTVQLLAREPYAISQAIHTQDITTDCTGVVVRGNFPTSLILQIHFSAQSTAAAGIQNVWIATANGATDQASAAAAAAKIAAPLLLSDPTSAPGPTTDELQIIKPFTIYIAGGTGTVDANTASTLGTYAINGFVREGGTDRFDTSAIIAQTSFSSSAPVDVFVWNGDDNTYYADGISAAMGAANRGGACFAVTGDILRADQTAALAALTPVHIYVVGSTAEVSAAMFSALTPFASGSITRFNGADRYATNLLVSQSVFTGTASNVLIVSGNGWPDGMVAASIAKQKNGPVLLINTGLTSTLKAELKRLAPTNIYVIGGVSAVSDTIKASLVPYATNVIRYAGTNRYTTAVAVLQNTASVLAGGGQFIRISNWSSKAPFPPGPYTVAYLSADATDITQDYVFNPFENIMFALTGGPTGATFQHFIVLVADMIPPGTGGSNVSSVRDPAITSVIAHWRDRWVF